MKTKKKGAKSLQKFTDFETLKTKEDFIKFKQDHPKKMEELTEYLYEKLNIALNAPEKVMGDVDRYFNRLTKLKEIQNDEAGLYYIKRERWYSNESLISVFITNSLVKTRIMPSVTDIAIGTGLSRVTIQKHLKERRTDQHYNEQNEMLQGMTHTVLAHLYRIGIEDRNVKALNAFLNHFSPSRSTSTSQSNTQNNYIQINGMILSQENVKLLPADQLKTIEDILKGSMIHSIQEISAQPSPQQTTLKS
jgi:hypothetical protein